MPYNSLVTMDPWVTRDAIVPQLAKSWEISGDGLTWTFQLREGVFFQSEHNDWTLEQDPPGMGKEFVCSDAKASMELNADPHADLFSKGVLGAQKSYYGHMESFSCPDGADGHTLEMKLSHQRNGTLSWMAIGLRIWQKEYREWLDTNHRGIHLQRTTEAWQSNIGTGAFIPTSFEDKAHSFMKKNPDYWREGAPLVDAIEWFIIQDVVTRYAAWATGKVVFFGHGSDGLTVPQVVKTQKDHPDWEIHQILHYIAYGIEFNTIKPPTDDFRVRRAIDLALDREQWREMKRAGTLDGALIYALLPAGGQVGERFLTQMWGNEPEEYMTWPGIRPKSTPGGQADIVEANRLLDEVFGEGERPVGLKCMTSSRAANVDYCLFFVEQMRKQLDWVVEMEVLESAALRERQNNCEYSFLATSTDRSLAGDPSGSFYERYHSNSMVRDCKVIHFPDDPDHVADYDKRIEEQDQELDPVRRNVLVKALEKDLVELRAARAPLGTVINFWGTRPELRGAKFIDVAYYGMWPIWERMWLNFD